MIIASPPPAPWTRSVTLLWTSSLAVTAALWLASPPRAGTPCPRADVGVDDAANVDPADGEFEGGADAEVNVAEVNVAGVDLDVHLVPAIVDGGVVGFRVYGVNDGSFLDVRGFDDGDVVTAINGRALVSPEQALLAFDALRTARDSRSGVARAQVVAVDGLRAGAAIHWQFVVDP